MVRRKPLPTDHLPSFEDLINAGIVDETGVVQPSPVDELDAVVLGEAIAEFEAGKPEGERTPRENLKPPMEDLGGFEGARGTLPLEPDEIVPPTATLVHPDAQAIGVIYESRIRVLDAWQYPGSVPASAPAWIDRNWIGWADNDGLRGLDAGPCLRVPLVTGVLGVCRVGDYVARQEVLMLPDFPGDIRIEVWPQTQFEKLFIPSTPAGSA